MDPGEETKSPQRRTTLEKRTSKLHLQGLNTPLQAAHLPQLYPHEIITTPIVLQTNFSYQVSHTKYNGIDTLMS